MTSDASELTATAGADQPPVGARTNRRRRTLPLLLLDTAGEMIDELTARLDAAGYTDIRPSFSRLFENLDPEGTRLTVLARRARMTHPSMVELVGRVEALGYVERRPDPTDRRARIVRFTPRGRTLQQRALTELATIEDAWIEQLGPGIADRLAAALHSRDLAE